MIRLFSTILTCCLLFGCGETDKTAPALSLALNWFPEAEHGGYYAVVIEGHAKRAGLHLEIQAGGPDAPVIQKVATGRAHYGIANADDVLNARVNGAPIVAIFAPININPRCIMVHASSNIQKISDIANMTLAMSARPAFSHWLQAQIAFENVNIVPYPSSLSVFLNDVHFAQQAYNISEPFVAKKMGAQPKVLMVSDLGFNPYCSVLITTEQRLKDHPEEVKELVTLCRKGWQDYLSKPEATNEHIHSINREMPLDVLAFGALELVQMTKPELTTSNFGEMTALRWKNLAEQMKAAKLIDLPEAELSKAWRNF